MNKKYFSLIHSASWFVAFLLLCGPLAVAKETVLEGGHDLGGGNAYELEFREVGFEIIKDFRASKNTESDLGFTIASLESSVENALIFSTKEASLTIEELANRHGLNSKTSQIILFSEEIWEKLSAGQKRSFALHEFLRFALDPDGKPVNDARGLVSSRALSLLEQVSASLFEEREVGSAYCRLFINSFSGDQMYWALSPGRDLVPTKRQLRQQCRAVNGENSESCRRANAILCERPLTAEQRNRYMRCTLNMGGGFFDLLFTTRHSGLGHTSFEAETKAMADCLKSKGSGCASKPQRSEKKSKSGPGLSCEILAPDQY